MEKREERDEEVIVFHSFLPASPFPAFSLIKKTQQPERLPGLIKFRNSQRQSDTFSSVT